MFLGLIHLNGWGVPKHKGWAAWYLKTFTDYAVPLLNDSNALEKKLFLIYALGRLRFHDKTFKAPKTAAQYFKWAAELGVVDAITYLGFCHYEGNSVEKNLSEAIKHFEIAARHKTPSLAAYRALAECHFSRQGGLGDREAETWLKKAIDAGDIEAARRKASKLLLSRSASSQLEAARLLLSGLEENYGPALYDWGKHCERNTFKLEQVDRIRLQLLNTGIVRPLCKAMILQQGR